MGEFTMPSLGADMDAGTLLEWYVEPGDAVKRGDIVALVDTDKAAIEVEIFEDGVIGELLVPPGEKVPVGTTLATVLPAGTAVERAPGEGTPAAPPQAEEARAAEAAARRAAAPPGARAPAPPPGGGHAPDAEIPPSTRATTGPSAAPAVPAAIAAVSGKRPRATPAARNHARALGIDLAEVTGTGKHGAITCQDVDAAARLAEAAVAEAAAGAAERAPVETTARAEPPRSRERAAPAERPAVTPAAPGPVPETRGPAPTVLPPDAHVRASPLARRLAAERGVDLTRVHGTGPGGAVTQEDVPGASPRAAAVPREARPGAAARPAAPETASTAAPPPATTAGAAGVPPGAGTAARSEDARYAAMRRAIAAAMSRSNREIPHYYLSLHVDMTRPLAWLEEANLQRPVTDRVLPAALVLKATALAARDVPDVNGFYLEDGFHGSAAVHLGVGISLRQGGLIAPAIHDADGKDLDRLMADLRDLVKRTRSLQLRSSELSDATMTTTNLGDQGVEGVYGIIYPPQVALVGFGRILERPWAENGMLAVRRQMLITLAADHRASDGHRGGLFLSAIERHLQHPEEL